LCVAQRGYLVNLDRIRQPKYQELQEHKDFDGTRQTRVPIDVGDKDWDLFDHVKGVIAAD
jgi:hypothetical protein